MPLPPRRRCLPCQRRRLRPARCNSSAPPIDREGWEVPVRKATEHGTTTGVGRDVHAGAPVTKGEKKKARRGQASAHDSTSTARNSHAICAWLEQLLGLEPTSCPAQPWRASGHRTHKRVMHSDKLYKAWRWIKQNNECVIRNNDMIDTLSAISVVVRSDGHILQRMPNDSIPVTPAAAFFFCT